jgi:hypothetical protein
MLSPDFFLKIFKNRRISCLPALTYVPRRGETIAGGMYKSYSPAFKNGGSAEGARQFLKRSEHGREVLIV